MCRESGTVELANLIPGYSALDQVMGNMALSICLPVVLLMCARQSGGEFDKSLASQLSRCHVPICWAHRELAERGFLPLGQTLLRTFNGRSSGSRSRHHVLVSLCCACTAVRDPEPVSVHMHGVQGTFLCAFSSADHVESVSALGPTADALVSNVPFPGPAGYALGYSQT